MHFLAHISHLGDMLDAVRQEAVLAGFDGAELKKIELAAEEVLVNIIRYAYAGPEAGEVEIECSSLGPKQLTITVRDQGVPFDPSRTAQSADTESDLHARRVGGLGLHLIYQLMDRVDYRREGEQNILTLTKNSRRMRAPTP